MNLIVHEHGMSSTYIFFYVLQLNFLHKDHIFIRCYLYILYEFVPIVNEASIVSGLLPLPHIRVVLLGSQERNMKNGHGKGGLAISLHFSEPPPQSV